MGLLLMEPLRAMLDFCAASLCNVASKVGDGHPVIVYPGLAAGALSTAHLRTHLTDSGFDVHDWGGGFNTGPEGIFEEWLPELAQRVRELHAREGRKVSLIGWSLGGIYAREAAKLAPGCVRQVISLGTPFAALGDATHAGTAFRLLGGDMSHLTPALQARLRACPPVPTTSIYSRTDGVVCWKACLQKAGERMQNVEVQASHLGIVTHPEVMRIVVDRLSLREGAWKPYRPPRTARAVPRVKAAATASTA